MHCSRVLMINKRKVSLLKSFVSSMRRKRTICVIGKLCKLYVFLNIDFRKQNKPYKKNLVEIMSKSF
jgi:hypothetical protein